MPADVELPGDELRWAAVDGALLVVTNGGALAITKDGTTEPVECL